MNIQSVVKNELVKSDGNVWQLKGHKHFGYSDGAESDLYLDKALRASKDLSTTSIELESWIKDWPSEYHLSTKRAQLFSGFKFDRTKHVLEVGCGCGAITRYLGENFDQVISIEGNLSRSHLARLRTHDLDAVSIICAPFQEIKFKKKFDIIFCIGVFEYSGEFVSGDDPYAAALSYFANMLTPNGILIIAIENQFGLKYFSCAREDHVGIMFEGLEGYHRQLSKVRTFGKCELQAQLKNYFPNIRFYYPYPDYKMPECVLSSQFVASGRAGELISQIRPRDYSGAMLRSWDAAAATLEIDRNGMLEFFANSFIAVAGRNELESIQFPQQGILYSSGRQPRFSTYTKFLGDPAGDLHVIKGLKSGEDEVSSGLLRLVPYEGEWLNGQSLQTQVLLRARNMHYSLADIFQPCIPWLTSLIGQGKLHGERVMLDGKHIDSIWGNSYVIDNECKVIDREYIWRDELPLNVIVIRAIFILLFKLNDQVQINSRLQSRVGFFLIRRIAASIGVKLTAKDFDEFIKVETELQWQVFGVAKKRHAIYLYWYFIDRVSLRRFSSLKGIVVDTFKRIRNRINLMSNMLLKANKSN